MHLSTRIEPSFYFVDFRQFDKSVSPNIQLSNSELFASILALGRGRFPECPSVKGLPRELIPDDIHNIATKPIPSSSCIPASEARRSGPASQSCRSQSATGSVFTLSSALLACFARSFAGHMSVRRLEFAEIRERNPFCFHLRGNRRT